MKKTIQRAALAVSTVCVLWAAGLPARAGQTESLVELKAKIQELDQKVKTLEHNRELDKETAESKAKESPKIALGNQGFVFASADTNFVLKLRGVLQLDSRTYFNDGGIQANDSFLLRRARPIIEGTVFRDFDFMFVPDFGGSTVQIFDAYLNYRYKAELQLRLGKFKSPVGLEQLQADRDTLFNERGLPTDLVPNRDVGVQLHGQLFEGGLSYAAGIFNGVGDARNANGTDFEDDKEFAGRVFVQPFLKSKITSLNGFGIGLGGSYGSSHTAAGLPSTTGGTLPGYTTDGRQQFFAYNPTGGAGVVANGEHWRISPQGNYYRGPFGLLGEYVISNQRASRTTTAPLVSRRLENTAWQIVGSWVLTGEPASYRELTPRKPFDPAAGNWGALQFVARYAALDVDNAAFPLFADPSTSARSADAWSIGLNWYLNRNVRVSTSFSRTTFSGGGGAGTTAPAIVTRQPENVFFTRVQLAF